MRNNILLLLVVLLSFLSCKKDDTTAPDVTPNNSISAKTTELNKFIHNNMAAYYLWSDEMPDLKPETHLDSKEYFNELLFSSIDKWSFITDDYKGLMGLFKGESKDFGYSLRPILLKNNQVAVCIEYVNPNTPASRAGLKRGDIITKLNGEKLNLSNYKEIFNKNDKTLTLGADTNNDGFIHELPGSKHLVAEAITVNPILKNTVMNVGNGKKVAYLAYTAFTAKYDDQLKQVFKSFKDAGVSDMILDLRYNGGGSVNSAKLMASMIGPSSIVGKVFIRSVYNKDYEKYLKEANPNDESIFIDRFIKTDNNLNLKNLYVLTTESTASASEMVMYSLSPYMNVIQIGEQTEGKYYASITISGDNANWAMQLIVLRAENANNSIDYTSGLKPDIQCIDDVRYELGSTDDILTKKALNMINKTPAAASPLKDKKYFVPYEFLKKIPGDPLKNDMYISLP